MTDKQAGWVVVPLSFVEECADVGYSRNHIAHAAQTIWSNRYEPGDAVVESVCRAYCESKHWDPDEPVTYSGTRKVCKDSDGHIVKQWEMHQEDARFFISAAHPELLARIEALESEVRNLTARRNELQADYMSSQYQLEQLQADVDRLRKGVL